MLIMNAVENVLISLLGATLKRFTLLNITRVVVTAVKENSCTASHDNSCCNEKMK